MNKALMLFFLITFSIVLRAQSAGLAPIGDGNSWIYYDTESYDFYYFSNVIVNIDSIPYNNCIDKEFSSSR